jgi:uncharacterized protein
MYFIDSLFGFAIGLALGLLGGGGSILTVPVLVYVVGQTPQAAVVASLMIVGTNSAMGAFFHRLHGTLNWRVALLFGGSGMGTAYLAAGLSAAVAPHVLMIFFALLMLAVAGLMLGQKRPPDDEAHFKGLAVTIMSGAAVGVLTGFLGVGGGFLIVPALVMLVGLPMAQAVGTSLIIIAMNSLAGFLGHLHGQHFDTATIIIVLIFATTGIAGAFAGTRLAKLMHPERLRQIFALFVIFLAVGLLYDNVGQLMR